MGGAILLFIVATGVIVGLMIHDNRLSWRAFVPSALLGLFIGGTAAGPALRQAVIDFFIWVFTGLSQMPRQ